MVLVKGRTAQLSVVISTYNRPDALDLVLQGYSNQRVLAKEIIIGDDGSTDQTAEVIKKWQRTGMTIVHCWHEDLGFRKTRIMNEAIRHVTSDYVVFTDGDCIPFPDFVADHAEYSETACLLAGGRILASESFTQRLENRTLDCFNRSPLFWFARRILGDINRIGPMFRVPGNTWRKSRPHSWESVRGCNFSLAMSDLKDTGGFDEALVGWGYEDSDLAIRLINTGLKVKSLRYAAPLLHLWHKENSRDNKADNYKHLEQTIALVRKRAVVGLEHTVDQVRDLRQ